MHKPQVKEINIRRPDEALIGQLEKLLEHAKTGELTGITYVSVWQGNSVDHGWAGMKWNYTRTVLGEIHLLLADITTMTLQDE